MNAYSNPWWALVYDQWNENAEGGRRGAHERELLFYLRQLGARPGRVLEAACGTGSILLPLLRDGLDIHGFDASQAMLDRLRHKAADLGVADIDTRITRQGLSDFRYDDGFDAILIPASSILLLPTQEEQIACLRAVHDHLRPSGRLLLDFFISTAEELAEFATTPPRVIELQRFVHPETGAPIDVSFTRVCQLLDQTERYEWLFTCDGDTETVPMAARWIYKEEFQLLLRLAGFSSWSLFGSCEDGAFPDPEETNDRRAIAYWSATA